MTGVETVRGEAPPATDGVVTDRPGRAGAARPARHGWRWWFHVIHRDAGYLCVGLVLVYAISGIAVNHVADWNPSYAITRWDDAIGPVAHGDTVDDAVAGEVLARLSLPREWLTLFQPGPHQLRIVRENHTIDVQLDSGRVEHSVVAERPVIHATNVLHLNHQKGLWTWVADAFAVALAALAITGMFLLKGRNGITGRGLWLVGAGVLLPLGFLWLHG